MGYNEKQIKELESTINRAQCDIVISGTPIDLERILKVNKPIIRARYEIGDEAAKKLEKILIDFCKKL
jgi:predicted GTPase